MKKGEKLNVLSDGRPDTAADLSVPPKPHLTTYNVGLHRQGRHKCASLGGSG
jgi:hypothetical protein